MKALLIEKYNQLKILFLATALCALLLLLRIKITQELFFLFLVWNLFLAFIPLGITYLMQQYKALTQNRFYLGLLISIWLLFLPNAPYVLTDFIHLSQSSGNLRIYDFILLTFFAATSLYVGFLSILELKHILKNTLSNRMLNCSIALILFMCGFGIYLGRFLRFNSWDVITNPSGLIKTLCLFCLHPIQYSGVWIFTLSFGGLLIVLFFSSQPYLKSNTL